MAKADIPVYDISSISKHQAQTDLLIERFGNYLTKHYEHLHHPHRHSFYHLVMFTKGEGSHAIDFSHFKVEPFQLYFMIPGQVHSWHFAGAVDGYIVHFNSSLFLQFLSSPNYLDQFPFFQGNASKSVCQLPVEIQQQVSGLFEAMLKEPDGSLDMIRLKLLELFITVNRACPHDTEKSIAPQKLTLLKAFTKLIDENFRVMKLPKEYAELLYVTPNHLNALAKDLVGKSAGDLIRERILLEAKRMLTNLNMSVAEIGYELNFQDNSYFNRFFKKNVGSTPDEFRKKLIAR